jgi:HAD superfamily phosphoserine phosphatase-like hydrolase
VKTLTAPNAPKPKLAVFDVEGVLIPKNRLFFSVAKSQGFFPLIKVLFYGFLYEVGLYPLKRALTQIFKVMRGAKVELLEEILARLPLMPNAADVFAKLRAQGCRTALVSSGLPTFLVEKIAGFVGADYAVGVELGINDGVLTGEVWGDVTERNGKFLVLKELMEEEHVQLSDCVVVADDRNNVSLFLPQIQKIGYDPDFVIRIKADVVVTGKLTKVIHAINHEPKKRKPPAPNDLVRESIHASGFFMPVLAVFFGLPIVAAFILTLIVLYTISEFSRINGVNMPIISTITRHAASQSELCQFTLAPIYFAVGILLTLVLFPAPASYAAVAIFTLGDSTASLVGGAFSRGGLRFNRAKSLEGSLGGFFFAFLAGSVFVSPWLALAGAMVGMFIEYLPLPVNDNLLIPLVTGLFLTFLI